jgi:HlyD family secretion protein
MLPLEGAGKVRVGQQVNIQLAGYPYLEYGSLIGVVNNISLVSSDNKYSLEISLSDSLKTNYGISLEMKSELQGTAEIITDDIRLLQRILNPIKSLLKKQSKN